MRKSLAVFVLLFLAWFAVPARAQESNSPQVPAAEVVAQSKPFFGTWDAISCQTPYPIGLRFVVVPGTEDDLRPQVLFVQVFDPADVPPTTELQAHWVTKDFVALKSGVVYLTVNNDNIELTLTPLHGRLYGRAVFAAEQADASVLAGKSSSTLAEFYSQNAPACSDKAKFYKFFGETLPPAEDSSAVDNNKL